MLSQRRHQREREREQWENEDCLNAPFPHYLHRSVRRKLLARCPLGVHKFAIEWSSLFPGSKRRGQTGAREVCMEVPKGRRLMTTTTTTTTPDSAGAKSSSAQLLVSPSPPPFWRTQKIEGEEKKRCPLFLILFVSLFERVTFPCRGQVWRWRKFVVVTFPP